MKRARILRGKAAAPTESYRCDKNNDDGEGRATFEGSIDRLSSRGDKRYSSSIDTEMLRDKIDRLILDNGQDKNIISREYDGRISGDMELQAVDELLKRALDVDRGSGLGQKGDEKGEQQVK